jgi:hypothetical protein
MKKQEASAMELISAHTFCYTPLQNSVKQSEQQKLVIEGNRRVFIQQPRGDGLIGTLLLKT